MESLKKSLPHNFGGAIVGALVQLAVFIPLYYFLLPIVLRFLNHLPMHSFLL